MRSGIFQLMPSERNIMGCSAVVQDDARCSNRYGFLFRRPVLELRSRGINKASSSFFFVFIQAGLTAFLFQCFDLGVF